MSLMRRSPTLGVGDASLDARHDKRHSGFIIFLTLILAACDSEAPAAPVGRSSSASPTAAASAAAQLTPVTIQISAIGLAFFPIFVAQDLGIFQKHGIDAKLLTMPPPAAIAGIEKGDVQFMATIGSAGRAIERGVELKVVDVAEARPSIVLVGAPGISQLSDLRGKVISASAPDDTLTQLTIAMLTKHGLPPDSYQILHTGTDQVARQATMENNQASAAVFDLVAYLSQEDKLRGAGYSQLANMMQEFEMPYSGLATSTKLVQTQPDVVRCTVAALVEATQVSGSDKERTTGVMMKELKLTPEVASKLFDECKDMSLWQTDGHASQTGQAFVFQMDQAALKLDKPPTESQIFDWSFLPSKG